MHKSSVVAPVQDKLACHYCADAMPNPVTSCSKEWLVPLLGGHASGSPLRAVLIEDVSHGVVGHMEHLILSSWPTRASSQVAQSAPTKQLPQEQACARQHAQRLGQKEGQKEDSTCPS